MEPHAPAASAYRWHHELGQLFERSVERYRSGKRKAGRFYDTAEAAYLESIGMSPQELFDFVEDHAKKGGDPDWETVLLITAVRRDYFLTVQHGRSDGRAVADLGKLPPKDAELGGIPWLPRLIEKARAKLRGEMPAELMYCCSGDRRFFREHSLHPADFLRQAWTCDFDPARLLAFVRGER